MAVKKQSGKSAALESDELLALARMDVEKGRHEEGLIKIKQVLAEKKPPAEAMAMAGRLYAQIGLHEKARTHLKDYLIANPDAIIEKFQLGMTYFDAGEQQQALDIWQEILQANSDNPPSLFFSGLALAQQGKKDEAKHSLNALIQSAKPENLYYARATELLKALDTGQTPPAGDSAQTNALANAYKTEH